MSDFSLRSLVPYSGMLLLMLATGLLSLLLFYPVTQAGLGAFEDPDSIANPFVFLFIMLVFTALLLLLIKWKAQTVISAIIGICLALVIYYVVSSLIFSYVPTLPASLIGIAAVVIGILLLWYRLEWYVINVSGILISAGCAAIFGISLSIIGTDSADCVRCGFGAPDKAYADACGWCSPPENADYVYCSQNPQLLLPEFRVFPAGQ